jgi:beta-lactamase regulating signal transducer with metallopeptidase domain
VQAILNWLWQGCFVVAAAALLFGRARRTSATTRYTLWWATLGAVLLLPLLPAIAGLAAPAASVDAAAAELPPVVLPRAPWWLAAASALIWSAWTALVLCRAAADFIRLQRARHHGIPLPAGREDRLRYWPAIRRTGRRARLIASSEVRVAAVLGLGAPAIAVAPEALDVLDDEALDHVLLHEWAHVQRHDDVMRLLEVVVRAVAGLHPAIWWIGRRMDIEREVACDDRVVQITGGAKRYAACLTQVAAAASGPRAAVLAPAALQRSQLGERVRRLLDGRRNASTARSAASVAAVLPMLAVITLASASVELVGTAPAIARALEAPERAVVTALSTRALVDDPDAELSPAHPGSEATAHVLPQVGMAPPHQSDAGPRRESRLVQSDGRTRRPQVDPNEDAADAQPRATLGSRPLLPGQAPATAPGVAPSTPTTGSAERHVPVTDAAAAETPSSWNAAARAGVSLGRGSKQAAVATAGFFSKTARRIAGSF